MLTRAGHKLAELIGDNLPTVSRKTTIELDLALLKITHEVKQGNNVPAQIARCACGRRGAAECGIM